MPTHWIPASTALALVPDKAAIVRRLYAGNIKALAQRLRVLEAAGIWERFDSPLTIDFWGALSSPTSMQDWDRGDFWVWLTPPHHHYQAYGVAFDLVGILEMLPVKERAKAARELSVTDNKEWLSSERVCRIAESSGVKPDRVWERVAELAAQGLLTARALEARATQGRKGAPRWRAVGDFHAPTLRAKQAKRQKAALRWEAAHWDVPTCLWKLVPESASFEDGQLRTRADAKSGEPGRLVTGIHFLRSSVEQAFQKAVADETSPARNRGGRPPAPITDQLWARLFAEGYVTGSFKPERLRQAEVARKMLDVAQQLGSDLSEGTAKAKARILRQELGRVEKIEGGKN